MSDWKKKVEEILTSGTELSSGELEEALVAALTERNALQQELTRVTAERDAYEAMALQMSTWLSTMSAAKLHQNAGKLLEELASFCKDHVQKAAANTGAMH